LGQLEDVFINATSATSISIPSTQVKLHQAAGILIFLAAILAMVSFIGNIWFSAKETVSSEEFFSN
jgi:hypothetical protein